MKSTEAVSRETLTTQVVRKLEAGILQMPTGTVLPSEAALAVRFGVNRLVLREATKTLQARGLLEIRQGKPAVVVDATDVLLRDFFRLSMMRDERSEFDLLELRRALEGFFAGLAAERAGQEEISSMQHLVADMETVEGAVGTAAASQAFLQADLDFHLALAAASRNPCAVGILNALAKPLRRGRARSLKGAVLLGALAEAVNSHREILDAVVHRDPEAARLRMLSHLERTERDLRAAGEPRRRGSPKLGATTTRQRPTLDEERP
jgi:GntR family transcriptional repressor for pyruvate dehydrogenase complex